MWKKMLVLAGLMGLLLCGNLARAQEEETTTPKITKVVLYKHGMGYFERRATVKGNAIITLNFKTNQIKDLLTSLFAIDEDGGRITSISYDSKDPIDKQLSNILFRVPEKAALTQFLTQLKGARIEVKFGSETVRGQILGIEPISEYVEGTVLKSYKLVLLREDGAIQPFDLLEIGSLKLLDEAIQKDLKRMLGIYLSAKYTDRKTVQLKATGKGQRNIRIGYLIETPIWKTSYRLILEEGEEPYLQGWAIVENTTDEDWEDVEISFVAGNPISFVLDLYTSYYPQRPVINLSSLIPLVGNLFQSQGLTAEYNRKGKYKMANKLAEYETTLLMKKDLVGKGVYDSIGVGGGAGSYGGGRRGGKRAMARSAMELLSSSVKTIAAGMALGELFAYHAKTPVTIQRHKAAMIPIITQHVDGDKVLYYRSSVSAYPMNAIYLTNSTKLTLEAGPVTLFEGSTSVGKGLIKKTFQPGMKEIIPYALETSCSTEVIGRNETKPVHRAKLTNGIMTLTRYNLRDTTYKCINQSNKSYTFYLDHPKASGYELVVPKKPEEEIDGYYRFKTQLGARKTLEFKVREKREIDSKVYVQKMSLDQIAFYLKEPYLSAQANKFLSDIQGLMTRIKEQTRIHKEANQEYKRLTEDQNRYRKNMQTLHVRNAREQEIRAKYVEKMDKVEDKIGVLRKKMLTAQDKKAELEKELIKKIQEFKEE